MKIGFIGTGNMASAMIRGMVSSGYLDAKSIFVYDVYPQAMESLTATVDVQSCDTAAQVVDAAEIVIFAVKPQVMEAVLSPLSPLLGTGEKLVVSIAAGLNLDSLCGFIADGEKTPIIRVMPNVNMMVGLSMSGVCANKNVTSHQVDTVLAMLRSVGEAVVLAEKDMSIFSAIAGCAPGYVSLFIDTLSRAGVKHGLSKKVATEIAAQSVLGSAKMLLESDGTPWDLVDTVCSPGGITVAGIMEMQDRGFQAAVIRGIDASVARDIELQNQA